MMNRPILTQMNRFVRRRRRRRRRRWRHRLKKSRSRLIARVNC